MVSMGLPQPAMPPANGRMGDFAALRGEQHTAALEGLLQAQRNGPVSGTGLQLACVTCWVTTMLMQYRVLE